MSFYFEYKINDISNNYYQIFQNDVYIINSGYKDYFIFR